MSSYFSRTIERSQSEVIGRTMAAFARKGFGIPATIDVTATM